MAPISALDVQNQTPAALSLFQVLPKIKLKNDTKKLNNVISKLESINIEELAKILITKKKTKLLEFDDWIFILKII